MNRLVRTGMGLCLLFAACAATAQPGPVRIAEVGLRGFYGTPPLRVRVEVSNPAAQAATLTLHFFVSELPDYEGGRTDKFHLPVSLTAGETRAVEVPLPLHLRQLPRVRVEARDASGRVLGGDKQQLETASSGPLVAILCEQESVCQEAQKQITFSGTMEEQVEKGKKLRLVAVQEPPEAWWAYRVASTVVVARDLARLSSAQREALELYARSARVILLEQEAADATFLAAYRSGPRGGRATPVAGGVLYRLSSLRSGELGALFQGNRMRDAEGEGVSRDSGFTAPEAAPSLDHLTNRLANRLTFPTLWWLLGWLSVYILAVGVVNFAALGRIRRREWGWMTVPVLALAFATGMYAASVASRPPTLSVDQVSLTWMDDRSPVAAVGVAVRITSPQRGTVDVSAPPMYVVIRWPSRRRASATDKLFERLSPEPPWEARLGPTVQFQLPMQQWSYDQMWMDRVWQAPGTLRRLGPNRLRNETGQNFRDALLVDADSVYFLGPVAAGAEMDLGATRKEPLRDHTGKWTGSWASFRRTGRVPNPEQLELESEEWEQILRGPFSLTELIRGWPHEPQSTFQLQSAIFFGLAEEAAAKVTLGDVPHESRSHAVTVVKFSRQP